MAAFVIRRSGPNGTLSGLLPASAYPMGKPMKIGSKDATTGQNTFVIADAECDGWLTRASRASVGSTDAELVDQSMGLPVAEMPFEVSKMGTIEDALELEVEGSDFIIGSTETGGISTVTAAGTKLSFEAGVLRVAQSTDIAQYELVAQMTPETAGNVRIFIKKLQGYLV